MGLIRCHFFSEVFQTHTDITVTMPEAAINVGYEALRHKRVLYPVIYILHGGAEESTMWMRMSRIEEYSKRFGFISVSINGMSSAYSDMVHGYKIFTFLTTELPKFVEGVFPASPCREDRYIAGFSMGGQGALKAAFRCPEKYAAAMPLCGARDIVSLFQKWESMENGPDLTAVRDALGPISELRGSNSDLVFLAHQAAKYDGCKPRLLVACALNDYAAELTEQYHQMLNEIGIEHTYYQAPGIHDYYFVDRALLWALTNWLHLATQPKIEEV